MPTRRSILQSAAVLSATSVAPKVVFADDIAQSGHIGVIYDSRHLESRTFGGRASRLGFLTHAIEGDHNGFLADGTAVPLEKGTRDDRRPD